MLSMLSKISFKPHKLLRYTCVALSVVMLIALNALLQCAHADEIWLDGGGDSGNATLVQVSNYTKEIHIKLKSSGFLNLEERWYYASAPTAGDYYITYEKVSKKDFQTINITLFAHGEQISDNIVIPTNKASFKIHVDNPDDTIFIAVWGSALPSTSEVYFSICFDGYHKPGTAEMTLQSASCQQPGKRATICTVCNEYAVFEEIPQLEHTPGNQEVIKAATCEENGSKGVKCITCGEVLSSEETPATGHNPGEQGVIIEPTCIATGLEGIQCITCGEVLSSETIPMAGHTIGLMTAVKPATCTEAGRNEQHCTVCNATLATEESVALGHTPGKWVDTLAATCTAEGQRVQYCSVCNATLNTEVVSAFGHSVMAWVTTREASCFQSGLREQKCSTCGVTVGSEEISALGHWYNEWEVTIEATKERAGEERRNCIHCGDTQFNEIPKIPKFLGIF